MRWRKSVTAHLRPFAHYGRRLLNVGSPCRRWRICSHQTNQPFRKLILTHSSKDGRLSIVFENRSEYNLTFLGNYPMTNCCLKGTGQNAYCKGDCCERTARNRACRHECLARQLYSRATRVCFVKGFFETSARRGIAVSLSCSYLERRFLPLASNIQAIGKRARRTLVERCYCHSRIGLGVRREHALSGNCSGR